MPAAAAVTTMLMPVLVLSTPVLVLALTRTHALARRHGQATRVVAVVAGVAAAVVAVTAVVEAAHLVAVVGEVVAERVVVDEVVDGVVGEVVAEGVVVAVAATVAVVVAVVVERRVVRAPTAPRHREASDGRRSEPVCLLTFWCPTEMQNSSR